MSDVQIFHKWIERDAVDGVRWHGLVFRTNSILHRKIIKFLSTQHPKYYWYSYETGRIEVHPYLYDMIKLKFSS